jgi:hypothetical protein
MSRHRVNFAQGNRFSLNAVANAIISASTPHAGTGRMNYTDDLVLQGLTIGNGMAEPGARTPVATAAAGLLATTALDAGLHSEPKKSVMDNDDHTGSITLKAGASEPGAAEKLDD